MLLSILLPGLHFSKLFQSESMGEYMLLPLDSVLYYPWDYRSLLSIVGHGPTILFHILFLLLSCYIKKDRLVIVIPTWLAANVLISVPSVLLLKFSNIQKYLKKFIVNTYIFSPSIFYQLYVLCFIYIYSDIHALI